MALRRIFVERVNGSRAKVTGERARHLCGVVRLRRSERVEVSDQSCVFSAVTTACSANAVEFALEARLCAAPPEPPLAAAVAIFKFSRFDWAVEKLTELGVDSIQPVIAERSGKGPAAAAGKRLERWRRIAFEAAQQSRRISAPLVREPRSFADAIMETEAAQAVLFDAQGAKLPNGLAAGPLTFFIGPEGGWTDLERERARAAGIACAGLGPLILRAETAAVCAAAVCRNQRMAEESPRADG